MSLRNILIVVIAVLGLATIYKNFIAQPAEVTVATALSNTKAPNLSASKAKTVVPPGGLQTYDQTRDYITSLKDEPLPNGYEVPSYITGGLERDQVYEVFAQRFPMFYGYGSTQLLDSIMANVDMYTVMLNENKAIRNQFDPNSKY